MYSKYTGNKFFGGVSWPSWTELSASGDNRGED